MAGIDVIREVYDAIGKQDVPKLMGLLHNDVRWTINVSDPGNVPWFGDFRGKEGVGQFFGGIAIEDTAQVKEALA